MAKRMLVDATHAEETRVVVVNGNKLDELDFEIASRRQLKGNIYLAKVTRVEPSLQAAFVEYGGNRHGFLAFSEIHPDYYRIPIADREALLAHERALEERAYAVNDERNGDEDAGDDDAEGEADDAEAEAGNGSEATDAEMRAGGYRAAEFRGETRSEPYDYSAPSSGEGTAGSAESPEAGAAEADAPEAEDPAGLEAAAASEVVGDAGFAPPVEPVPAGETPVDDLGGDEAEDVQRRRPRPLRSYKIQEVIKRRQILLVQVVKEERGNKGAALTTYLSLPGRYCVLMPNTGRGGGISRKITNPQDRKRLKEMLSDLDIPEGMAVILRTAGMERSKQEIKRDLEYLLRLWDSIRELTLQSTAPALIYEEANLIKRTIRDLYANDIDEVLVEGEAGFRAARDFMTMLMPGHTRKIQRYQDETIPLFFRYQVETQIDAIHNPVVQLRSGGYIVINQTEALVAIDVNSGRATKERNIEETAFKTNLEAAEEVARQLRLRDLAGLIVIDFIDMEDGRNNAAVEKRLKEAMKNDRARIQLGRISPFGLLELSRQRLRPSLIETNFEKCAHCAGTGMVRSIESAALYVLRAIEEEGIRKRSSEITIHVATRIALYILNQKRDALSDIERRYGFRVYLFGDDTLMAPEYRLERIKARSAQEDATPIINTDRILAETDRVLEREAAEAVEEAEPEAEVEETEEGAEADAEGGDERGERRRRRRRRRRHGDERAERPAEEGREAVAEAEPFQPAEGEGEGENESAEDTGEDEEEEREGAFADTDANGDGDGQRRRRRRGKRGGRRRSRGRNENGVQEEGGYAEGDEGDPEDRGTEEPEAPAAAAHPALPSAGHVVAGADDLGDVFGDLDLGIVPEPEPAAEPQAEPEASLAEERPAAEPVAAEAPAPVEEAAPVKKPRNRRKKAEPQAEETAQPAVSAPAAPAETVTQAPETEAPKPKRARAPRKKKEADAGTAAVEAAVEAAGETAPKPAAEAEPAKPKRARAPRKKKVAEEPPVEGQVVGEPAAAEPAPALQENAAQENAAQETEAAPAPAAQSPAAVGDTGSPSGEDGPEAADGSSAPPRRGWWRRG
jgi:ribonuclease E